MPTNWAICIGINQYANLQDLSFAKGDAEAMQAFLLQEAGLERVYLFTDNSPPITDASKPYASQPTYTNLRRFLRVRFEEPFLSAGDTLWFFFSGHGVRFMDCDYLVPADADPGDINHTAISLHYITQRLRRSGADNIILLLDACRNQRNREKFGLGVGTEHQKGVITVFSCSPEEQSWEAEALQQGTFTYALLEGLRLQGANNCATVERLDRYLRHRVPALNRQQGKLPQTPYTIAEPISKLHLILLPQRATPQDVATLKLDAYKAETEGDIDLAWQLWIRVNSATAGSDMDAIAAFQRLAQRQSQEELPALASEKGIDYTRLRDLLAAADWRRADEETWRLMLSIPGRTKEGWLRVEDVDTFPATDLNTIDRLWRTYSGDRFGFSIQKQIYQSLGGTRKYDEAVWNAFGDRLGWRKDGKWLSYDQLALDWQDLDWNSTPRGYLPAFVGRRSWDWAAFVGGPLLSREDL